MYWLWLPKRTGQFPLPIFNNEHKNGIYTDKQDSNLGAILVKIAQSDVMEWFMLKEWWGLS